MFHRLLILLQIVQLILFIVDSGCTKHMTGNLKLLCNFIEKYMGTVRFGSDQFAPILGYRDLVQGNITINMVYYIEGLNHNLFLVGQFCDADLEVSFWNLHVLLEILGQHRRMILESVEHGPLLWPTIEEDGVTRLKKYSELSAAEAIQADCDVKATNIILQGLPLEVYALVSTHKVAKELWERIQMLMQGTTTIVEVPKELPKVSLVNSCLKKLKFHLARFDMVVKERTTATAITKGAWGFKHTKACFRDEIIPFVKALKELFTSFDQCLIGEVTKVQNVFKQMELAVEQHCEEKNKFLNKMKSALKDNDRLLTQALSVDIVNLVLYDNVNVDSQAQAKDTMILKLKEKLHSLSGDVNERNVKIEVEEIETLNIKLDHKVTKLVAENKHLKQTYKQLYDSIKSLRVRSKEQCDDLINKVNLKSAKVSNLNASLQEKVLVIIALKEQLNKLEGKAVITEAVPLNPIDPELLKVDVAPLAPKLRKNRTAHTNYIRHTQKEAATLREVVESEKLLNLLNTSLDYAMILKLKENLQSLSGDVNERKVKRELEEIETLNIELDYKVTKLIAENEHLKQTYKQLYDSIKSSREKVLVITALKEQLNKFKGKAVITEAVSLNSIDPELLKVDVAPLAPKLRVILGSSARRSSYDR
nr:integrase, catalytic region, zinc finger, CCHC-type, peptidase aspartic, catalytic [Tanacetum cinerariifolium]